MNHLVFDAALATVSGATLFTVILGFFKVGRWSGQIDTRLNGVSERLHRIEDYINNK